MKCALCGASTRRIAYPGADTPAARDLGLDGIAVCEGCGFGRAVPYPDQPQLDALYASGKYWHGSTNKYQLAHERVQADLRVQRCAPMLAGKRDLRVLDVGAGHGFIAGALEDAAYVSAYDFIEPDDSAARHIENGTGAFRRRRLPSIELADYYDVLFLNHVLEHVADPEDFMRRVLSHLEPGGHAYVETPLADYRFKVNVFPHVLFFTPSAFSELAKRLGVDTVAVEAFGRMPGSPFVHSVADIAFRVAVNCAVFAVQKAIDRAIWRYRVARDGVWLRWILRRGNPSG